MDFQKLFLDKDLPMQFAILSCSNLLCLTQDPPLIVFQERIARMLCDSFFFVLSVVSGNMSHACWIQLENIWN